MHHGVGLPYNNMVEREMHYTLRRCKTNLSSYHLTPKLLFYQFSLKYKEYSTTIDVWYRYSKNHELCNKQRTIEQESSCKSTSKIYQPNVQWPSASNHHELQIQSNTSQSHPHRFHNRPQTFPNISFALLHILVYPSQSPNLNASNAFKNITKGVFSLF